MVVSFYNGGNWGDSILRSVGWSFNKDLGKTKKIYFQINLVGGKVRKNFYDYRNDTGFTLGEMAEKLGCTRSYLQLIESNQREGSLLFWENFQNTFNIADENMWRLMKRSGKCEECNVGN